MAKIKDVWIRRLTGENGSADFLHISSNNANIGIWGPILAIQSMIILSILRNRLIGLDLEQARSAISAASRERHATGYFSMACTACNLAIWDLKGIEAIVPVTGLLGTPLRTEIPCYASMLGEDLCNPPPMSDLIEIGQNFWGLKWACRFNSDTQSPPPVPK